MSSQIKDDPPTIEDVKIHQYWWNFPSSGNLPFVIQLDVDEEENVIYELPLNIKFNVDDYPGKWAPCIPPEEE